MCRILGLSRQSYYYQSKPKKDESELEEVVAEEFILSRKAYGSRKIKKAFSRIRQPLTEVEIFHTDRGKEFDNQAIDELLTTFDINRSLSHKGCPFDNAVAESTYKSLKVEFVYQYTFETLQQLDLELFDYVNWWNHLRLHGTLGYETPVGYRNQRLAQRILDNELGCANASEAV